MGEYPGTDGLFRRYISERHCGRIRDLSLGDREDRQMLVKTLRRRFPEEVRQTNIIHIDCRAFRDPACQCFAKSSRSRSSDHALQDSESVGESLMFLRSRFDS